MSSCLVTSLLTPPEGPTRSEWFVSWWISAVLKGLHCQECVGFDRRAYTYRATIEPAMSATHLEKVEFLGLICDYVSRESAELHAMRAAHTKLGDTVTLTHCPLEQLEHDRTMNRRRATTQILSQLLRVLRAVAPRPSSRSLLERIYAVASSIPHCESATASAIFEEIHAAYHAVSSPVDRMPPCPLLSEVELLAYVTREWEHDRFPFPWAKVFQAWIVPPPAVAAAAAPAAQESEEDHYA